MNIEKQALVVAAFSFFIILVMGVVMTVNNYAGYQFTLGKGRGGGGGDYYINGEILIGIAILFGAFIVWMYLGMKKGKR